MEVNLDFGRKLVKEARKVIESHLEGIDYDPDVEGFAGVFVTLKKNGVLRGCIGVPFPMDLRKALKEAAIGAIYDPRFPPLRKEELDSVTVEVSLLTEPEVVEDPLKEIQIGKHGIIVIRGYNSGLLLPQVPVEEGWDLEEFLDYSCLKAGLPPGCWRDPLTRIMKFEARVFEEVSPRGDVVEKKLQ